MQTDTMDFRPGGRRRPGGNRTLIWTVTALLLGFSGGIEVAHLAQRAVPICMPAGAPGTGPGSPQVNTGAPNAATATD